MCSFGVEVSTFFLESLGSGQHLDSEDISLPKCGRRAEEWLLFFIDFLGVLTTWGLTHGPRHLAT